MTWNVLNVKSNNQKQTIRENPFIFVILGGNKFLSADLMEKKNSVSGMG